MDARDYGNSGCLITRNEASTLSERYILPARAKAGKAGVYDRKAGVYDRKAGVYDRKAGVEERKC